MENGYYTRKEINAQSEAFEKVLERKEEIREILSFDRAENVVFVGCGSSYYLSISATYHLRRRLNIPSYAFTGFGTFKYPDTRFEEGKDYTVIGISRSGESSETVMALKSLKDNKNIQTIALTCTPDSSLTKVSDRSLVLPFLEEKSVVMTGSFTSMLLSLQGAMGDEGLDALPEFAGEILDESFQSFDELNGFEHFVYLGYDEYFGLANEGALKMREMALGHTESYESLEYRHGPKSLVTDKTLILIMPSKESLGEEEELSREMRKLGATTVNVSPWKSDAFDLWIDTKLDVSNRSDVALRMIPLQVVAFKKAIQKGIDPDVPVNLDKVVKL
ncbi:MAG: SIS domain-containing protein [Thermotogae bacterium]|nr:SIS domain-containing protein [Thermotogota bacterium]